MFLIHIRVGNIFQVILFFFQLWSKNVNFSQFIKSRNLDFYFLKKSAAKSWFLLNSQFYVIKKIPSFILSIFITKFQFLQFSQFPSKFIFHDFSHFFKSKNAGCILNTIFTILGDFNQKLPIINIFELSPWFFEFTIFSISLQNLHNFFTFRSEKSEFYNSFNFYKKIKIFHNLINIYRNANFYIFFLQILTGKCIFWNCIGIRYLNFWILIYTIFFNFHPKTLIFPSMFYSKSKNVTPLNFFNITVSILENFEFFT